MLTEFGTVFYEESSDRRSNLLDANIWVNRHQWKDNSRRAVCKLVANIWAPVNPTRFDGVYSMENKLANPIDTLQSVRFTKERFVKYLH